MSGPLKFAGMSSETKLAVDPTKPLLYSSPQFTTYRHGFRQPVEKLSGPAVEPLAEGEEPASYQLPKAVPELTAIKENVHGVFVENTYPEILSGTNAPGGPPKWWKKETEVDVLICGGKQIMFISLSGDLQGDADMNLIFYLYRRPVRTPSRHVPCPSGTLFPDCR